MSDKPVASAAASRFASQTALARHVWHLAGEIGERHVFRPEALAAAEAYVTEQLDACGYRVTPQEYRVHGLRCANLEITVPGECADRHLLIGAHYDSVPGSPGANDNASGVAALLELARLLALQQAAIDIRLVAFVNEEPPFFFTGQQGSRVYARAARQRADDIRLMIALETVGYYSSAPGSQHYPPLFRWFYPDRADFVALVSNMRSRRWVRRLADAFRRCSDFPVEHAATFGWIPGVAWSDHLSFWRSGYRALMVTDTAFYRYAHYHSPQDTPEKVDCASLARVTDGLHGAIRLLAAEHG